MTRKQLDTLYNAMKKAEAECSRLYDHRNTLDGQLSYDAAWDVRWKATRAYEEASREYRRALVAA